MPQGMRRTRQKMPPRRREKGRVRMHSAFLYEPKASKNSPVRCKHRRVFLSLVVRFIPETGRAGTDCVFGEAPNPRAKRYEVSLHKNSAQRVTLHYQSFQGKSQRVIEELSLRKTIIKNERAPLQNPFCDGTLWDKRFDQPNSARPV